MSKEKLSFSFHSLLSSHRVFSLSLSIFFFSFACSQSCSSSRLRQSSISFAGTSLFSGGFTSSPPSSLAEWPLYFFLHLFLLFFLSHSSHQVTINASQLILTLLQSISFLQLSLNRMTLASCFFLFFLPSNVSHKFNITYSFMWLNFYTSLHKCCWTFVHNYRGKDEPNFFSFSSRQATPANPSHFADFSALVQQAHLMS